MNFVNIERLLKSKSRVDLTLSVEACKAKYMYNISDIIVVSSDSDYSTLYEQMCSTNFFVLYDSNKWSSKSAEFLQKHYIQSMDINQFTPKSLAELRDFIITEAINKVLKEKFRISFNEVIDSVKKECNLNFYNDYENTIIEKLNCVKISNTGTELSAFVDKKR
jgi:hypothetical protein